MTRLPVASAALMLSLLLAVAATAETPPVTLYRSLQAFELSGEAVRVDNFTFARDRAQFTLHGEIYFAHPVAGGIHGGVFLGEGRLRLEPTSSFETENLRRFLNADVVDATFKSAVLRFSDDTYEKLSTAAAPAPGPAADRARKLASELEGRLVRETGLNLSARLALAILNRDEPGVFFGEFDGGDRGRFCLLLDHQTHTLDAVFGVNAGEKGLLYQYRDSLDGYDVWTAFYNLDDYQRGRVTYSDAFDLVNIPDTRLQVDVREPGKWLRIKATLDLVALREGVQLIPFRLNEGLDEHDNERLKKGLRVLGGTLEDGSRVEVIQEDWETGFSLAFPEPLVRNETARVTLEFEGRDTLWTWQSHYHYPRSTTTWFPRHGYLGRSRFDSTFLHDKRDRVVSVGERLREGPAEDRADVWATQWVMRHPVSFVSFAVGRFERHDDVAELGGLKIPIEFYSVPGVVMQVKEDFLLAELNNGVRYFSELYGPYPYGRLGAVFFPSFFGQGFPTMLLLPARGFAHQGEFAFLAHEGAHQWWGNIVAWRSYRDQWLSEGFAEYSGALYTAVRMKPKDGLELIRDMKRNLEEPPGTDTGIASGKLYEVGPLVLGHRLSTRRSRGAYTALIYSKGALVLRMLHFLLSNPATGDDTAFFEMMKDFVKRHHDGWASTESFLAVASEHFARSPIGLKYGLADLNWFLRQWVYQTALPSYRLEYKVEREGGTVVLTGTLYQEGAPDNWFMPLPLVIEFGEHTGQGTVHAMGPATPVRIPLPSEPRKVRLDPDNWVLSLKTTEKKVK